MEFVEKILGITVKYGEELKKVFPNFIHGRYNLRYVWLGKEKVILVFPKRELEPIKLVKSHLDYIIEKESLPVVLILDKTTYLEREYLLREKLPFIVKDRQIYLPFLGVYLQELYSAEKKNLDKLLPSSQLLLLLFIYEGCRDLPASEAVKMLEFTPTTISRAAGQLEDLGLIETRKEGVKKIITSEFRPKELFKKAGAYLRSPVKRTVYVLKTELDENLLRSSYSALSDYSMLSNSEEIYYASDSIKKWERDSTKKLLDPEDQCAIELWRYDPKKLSRDDLVDPLSLALALEEDYDERVEQAVEEMLDNLWEEIDKSVE